MPLHDIHYQHWKGKSVGLTARRYVIAKTGLMACLNNKILRVSVVLCWSGGLFMVAAMFAISQLLVDDSIVKKWTTQLNPALQQFAAFLTNWLLNHPEISVRTSQNILFYFAATILTPVSIFALGVAMPFMITRDLGSNAIVIYSSKAITRWDYLLGKYCIALGVLTMTWLGPLCCAWVVGNLLAPHWDFFWHSREAICNLLLYGVGFMAVLAALALGVSATSGSDKSTPSLWFIWWVLGYVIQPIALNTKPWLRHVSFTYNLEQFRLYVFNLGADIHTAQANIPILGTLLGGIPARTMEALNAPQIGSAMAALGLMVIGAGLIINKKVKPE